MTKDVEQRTYERWEVLAEELEDRKRPLSTDFVRSRDAYIAAGKDDKDAKRAELEQHLFRDLRAANLTALCFSGGGVRSATFGLGVLQGLATCPFSNDGDSPPLTDFDYLSTVSGGGYVGGWFSAWAARLGDAASVVAALKKRPENPPFETEAAPLMHLRQYCAFLDPKLGLLSADSWTLLSTVARNLLLNWLILLPLIVAGLLPLRIYRELIRICVAPDGLVDGSLWAGAAAAIWAVAYITSQIPVFRGRRGSGEDRYIVCALFPLLFAGWALSLHWVWRAAPYSAMCFLRFGAAVHFLGWAAGLAFLAVTGKLTQSARKWPNGAKGACGGLFAAAISGALAGGLIYLVSARFQTPLDGNGDLYACLAFPTILGAFVLAALLAVGFSSFVTGDSDREWWARAGAWILIAGCGWLVAAVAIVYGQGWLRSGWTSASAAIGSLGLGGMASKLGFSPSTPSGRDGESAPGGLIKQFGLKLIGPLFLLCLIVLLASAGDAGVALVQTCLRGVPAACHQLWAASGLLVSCLALALASSWFINVNRFSLHAMYRDRLIRTYLGASRADRAKTVNPFTDLDDADNVLMKDLPEDGPLHIVNMALNLAGGDNLAWQQRRAESFTASRLHTGSLNPQVGYQRTKEYGGENGLSLGSAIAISGAAASPNMGYHSSPLITFIMMLFNARLGWWLANPGTPGRCVWRNDGPGLAIRAVVNELLGRTDDKHPWIYLSDGGHFENLGLYEMVLRRCQTIVVVDGSEDLAYGFEDLGNALRKVRVDLGIDIEFGQQGIPIYGRLDERNRYCAIGRIRYRHDEPALDGRLVYVKACLNGREPRDVLQYAHAEPHFPQQGTEELWFHEDQFESYRRLGLHIMNALQSAAGAGLGSKGPDRVWKAARRFCSLSGSQLG